MRRRNVGSRRTSVAMTRKPRYLTVGRSLYPSLCNRSAATASDKPVRISEPRSRVVRDIMTVVSRQEPGPSEMEATHRRPAHNGSAGRAIVTTLVAGSAARAQEHQIPQPGAGETGYVMRLTPAELVWTAGRPMLPPGARMAVL